MIIDCHTHIFPEEIKKNREAFFEGEGAFKLLYENPQSKIKTAEELLASMDESSVEKSMVFGFPWNSEEKARLNNDYIIEMADKYKSRLIPFSCFNPVADYAEKEASRAVENGFTGFGELGLYEDDFSESIIKKIAPVMDIAKKNSMPVIFHVNEPCGHKYPGKAPISIKGISDFIQAYPENRIILAHFGGGLPFFSMLKKGIPLKNIMFDTAAMPFIYKKEIYKIIPMLGLEKNIVFGSDWPLISPMRYIKEIDAAIGGDEYLKEDIFYRNIMNFIS